MLFFPTSGSLECELYSNDINNLKEIKFLTSGINYTRKIKSGDIVIMNESEQISNIIRKPLYKYKFEFVYGNNVEVLNLASGSRLIFGTDTELKKEEGTVNLSFEIDRDKMFDSYFEKYNQMPTYIDNICFLKNDTEYYCQNNLEKFIDLKNADIISADFNIYNFLNSGEADVFDIKESWSTVLVSKIQPENCSYIKTVGLKSQKYSSVDITNELKNKENDFCGLKFVSKSGEAYLATSDNYHNPFYYRITFNGDIKNRYTL